MKEELLNALYCEFINRVNEVGVDVNRAIAHPHSQALLQYVCGLGPRKGTHLLKVRRLLALPAKTAHQQHSVSTQEVSQGPLCLVQLTALLMGFFTLLCLAPKLHVYVCVLDRPKQLSRAVSPSQFPNPQEWMCCQSVKTPPQCRKHEAKSQHFSWELEP